MTTQTKTLLPLLAFMILTLTACSSGGEQKPDREQTVKITKRQDTYDAHGCITSAGYLWSGAKDTCILLWESATELQATNRSEFVLYAVISEDKMKAEIFVPEDTSFLLSGKGNGIYNNDSFQLSVNGKDLQLKKNGKTIYQTAVPDYAEEQPRHTKRRRR